MSRPIGSMLSTFALKDSVSFHMPGHKGVGSFLEPGFLCYDITELPGSDNLYDPNGVIKESQDLYAPYLNADSIYYLVNGSTSGVISSLLSICGIKKVLFSRNIHVSSVSGMILSGITPCFIYGDDSGFVSENDIIASMNEENPDALFLVYPDYRGNCFDLKLVCKEAHKRDILVIVDSAHGAGFSFSEKLPLDCGRAGADIWTISMHKTLAAVNQSAVLCLSKSYSCRTDVKRYINLIQTTSPSYPILASIEYSLAESAEKGSLLYDDLYSNITCFISKLTGIGCFGFKNISRAFDRDFTRIYIYNDHVSGFTLSKVFSASNIYVEAADTEGILLLTSVYNKKDDFDHFIKVAESLDIADEERLSVKYAYADDIVISPRESFFGNSVKIPLEKAAGRISCDSVGCYPPGIPVVLPGCRITTEQVEYLRTADESGYDLFGLYDNMIRVLEG